MSKKIIRRLRIFLHSKHIAKRSLLFFQDLNIFFLKGTRQRRLLHYVTSSLDTQEELTEKKEPKYTPPRVRELVEVENKIIRQVQNQTHVVPE